MLPLEGRADAPHVDPVPRIACLRRSLPASPALLAGILGLLALPGLGCGRGSATREAAGAQSPPPVLLKLRDFHLVDQDGAPVDPDRLRGRIWVLDFVFTRCPSVCPSLTKTLLELAHEWRKEPRVAFLSVSVDPDYDRPEVLRRYAGLYGPRPRNWLLATGAREAVRDLVMGQVKVAMGEGPGPDGDITHSTRFVLVDPELRIRGFYRALEPEGRAALEADLRALLSDPGTEADGGAAAGDLAGLPCPAGTGPPAGEAH